MVILPASTYIPNATRVAAGGNGFVTTNIPGYSTGFNGLELGLVKRLSNRWMSRVSFSWNNAREHFDTTAGVYDTNGNPTPTLSEPLKDGGQFAPQSGGSGSGSIYINAKWQFNANALYQAPYGIDISGNVFGRQGYPYPLFRRTNHRSTRRRFDSIGARHRDSTACSYYNYDNFEEIQVSTAGQDIKQPTGGMGLNLVVKRGTNQFHGGVRGYFDNHAMESTNVPASSPPRA